MAIDAHTRRSPNWERVVDEFRSALHPLLAGRWSPKTFDATHDVSPEEVALLLEAARWAPSAGNSQPWAFLTASRGTPMHERLVRHLAQSSEAWAPAASLLVVNLSHRCIEDTGEYSEFAGYDLGQAVAHMTVQGQALGLHARQFRAFDRAGIASDFDVPQPWEVTTLTAFGRPQPEAPADRAGAGTVARARRPIQQLAWPAARTASG